MRSSTRAWRKSSLISTTRMPANRNGGHKLSMRRMVRAETLRMVSGQQQRRHLAAEAPDQALVLEDPERVDQGLLRHAVVAVAVAPQHLHSLFPPAPGVAHHHPLTAHTPAWPQLP